MPISQGFYIHTHKKTNDIFLKFQVIYLVCQKS